LAKLSQFERRRPVPPPHRRAPGAATLADSNLKARLSNLGAEPMPMQPAEFERFIADEIVTWAKVIRSANIKPE
jgi:hypothetical protein